MRGEKKSKWLANTLAAAPSKPTALLLYIEKRKSAQFLTGVFAVLFYACLTNSHSSEPVITDHLPTMIQSMDVNQRAWRVHHPSLLILATASQKSLRKSFGMKTSVASIDFLGRKNILIMCSNESCDGFWKGAKLSCAQQAVNMSVFFL